MINLHVPVFNNRWKAPPAAEPVHEPFWDATPAWRHKGWSQDRKHRTASHCHGSAGGLLKIGAFLHNSIYETFVKLAKHSEKFPYTERLWQILKHSETL